MWLIASLRKHANETSDRMWWLNAFDVVFLLVRVMGGTQRVMWFMQSIGGVA